MLHASAHLGSLLVFTFLAPRQLLVILAVELHPNFDLALAQQLLGIFGMIMSDDTETAGF